MVRPGSYPQTVTHFDILRTLEDMYDLPYAGASATASPLTSAFQGLMQFSAATYSAGEGDGTLTVTVTRNGGTDLPASVSFATVDGTAAAGQDYTAVSGTLNFAVGETSQTITIPVAADASVEPWETFTITLSQPSAGNALGNPTAAVVTLRDASATGQVRFSDDAYVAAESAGGADITLLRGEGSTGSLTVTFGFAEGTAAPTNQDVTFADGETIRTVRVPITDNAAVDGRRQILLTVGPAGASPDMATLTVTDNDGSATQRFVAFAYLETLGVPVDAGGLTYWTNIINTNPSNGRQQFVQALQSTELGRRVQLDRLYQQYISRDVDEGGRIFWTNLLNQRRVNLDQIGGFVISSPEFLQQVGGTANAFVAAVIQRATGRLPNAIDPSVPTDLLDATLIDISGNGRIGSEDAGFTTGQLSRFRYSLRVNGGDGLRRVTSADQLTVDNYYRIAGLALDSERAPLVGILQALRFYPFDEDVVYAMILA